MGGGKGGCGGEESNQDPGTGIQIQSLKNNVQPPPSKKTTLGQIPKGCQSAGTDTGVLRRQSCDVFSRDLEQNRFILSLAIGQMLKSYFPYMTRTLTSISTAVTLLSITTNSSVVLLALKS